jgi:hypothetical protein
MNKVILRSDPTVERDGDAMMQTISISKEEVLDPNRIPEQFRGPPARPITIEACKKRVEYWLYHLERVRLQRFGPYAFEYQQKYEIVDSRLLDKLLRVYKKKLDQAIEELRNAHQCECCGLLLTKTAAPVGPECAKHPDKFPCNRHRSTRKWGDSK